MIEAQEWPKGAKGEGRLTVGGWIDDPNRTGVDRNGIDDWVRATMGLGGSILIAERPFLTTPPPGVILVPYIST
jgi:hypothetical protein